MNQNFKFSLITKFVYILKLEKCNMNNKSYWVLKIPFCIKVNMFKEKFEIDVNKLWKLDSAIFENFL